MGGKKIFLAVLIIALVFGSVIAGLSWHMDHYVLVDLEFYPKDAQVLDLRGQDITVRKFERISRRLPGCEIIWDVPLSEGKYDSSAREITVSSLKKDDLRRLEYLTRLETVRAEECRDYALLQQLVDLRPELQITYRVELADGSYPQDTQALEVTALTGEELALLQYLPRLQAVTCTGGETEQIRALQSYCHEKEIAFAVKMGETVLPDTQTEITAERVTEQDLKMLTFLTGLEKIHLTEPQVSAQSLLQLRQDLPQATVTWERELLGKVYTSRVQKLDLSKKKVTDLEALARELEYFPNLSQVYLGSSTLDNEALAAFREEHREEYKVVWTVQLGSKLTARTDDTTFMPVRENVYYFNDEEAYNLRYCEDMVCIDIGHMSISNIDFVKYMPNLEYLVLAHTQLQYIEPLSTCKKLKFLELDWSPVKDLTPLKECTALEDLNLGNVYADFAPVGEMTWLNNLWMIGCSDGARYRMTQALPDTKVMVTGSATVANGWRDLSNYYAMRDLLGMEYMKW